MLNNFSYIDSYLLNRASLKDGLPTLEDFLKSLEQYYFAKVSITSYKVNGNLIDLVLEIDCPLSLLEVLAHFNKQQWGYCGQKVNPFQKTLEELDAKADFSIDILELNLIFKETRIIIKKEIFRSIPTQLNTIISSLAKHYVYISKGLEESPYEIYLPVYEDIFSGNTQCTSKRDVAVNPYFQYWGIYLESETEAQVYDVRQRIFVPASLDLCMLEED
jgi:hypothetical protein